MCYKNWRGIRIALKIPKLPPWLFPSLSTCLICQDQMIINIEESGAPSKSYFHYPSEQGHLIISALLLANKAYDLRLGRRWKMLSAAIFRLG